MFLHLHLGCERISENNLLDANLLSNIPKSNPVTQAWMQNIDDPAMAEKCSVKVIVDIYHY